MSLVGSVGIVGMVDLFLSVGLVRLFGLVNLARQVVLVWELRSCLRDDTLCHALSTCLLFTFWYGSRMWVCLWSVLLVSLRTRIVSIKICVLNWLRQHTLCYALSKCLLFTFWDGSRKILWLLLVRVEWMECRCLLIQRRSYAGTPIIFSLLVSWTNSDELVFLRCSWHCCYGCSYFICWFSA